MSISANWRSPLRVAIDAQVTPNSGVGGVESVLIALIHALGQLKDGTEEYTIIGPWQNPQWLQPYVGPNQRLISGPQPANLQRGRANIIEFGKRVLGPLHPFVGQKWRAISSIVRRRARLLSPQQWADVPVSIGFHESLSCHVLHVPHQGFIRCRMPTIYNPHDLQHLHYPQFFSRPELAWREAVYPAGCQLSNTVVVASEWIKRNIQQHYKIASGKIQVIPWAPPTYAHPKPTSIAINAVRERYELPPVFAFYPAMTWEHKNHLRLLDALALLRDREGLRVNLICTGHQNAFWPHIEKQIQTQGLQTQVKFLGLVPAKDLRAIYRLAQFVIVPTLFEAASGPLFEAWQEGTPVACSAVTSLPEQAGDAALLFDPHSTEAIADALARLATQADVREALRLSGARRLQDFSWERTAKAYRAVYRRAAQHPLSEEDQHLLDWDWMKDAQGRMEARL